MARKLRKHRRQVQVAKTKEQETKITKVVEDNSVVLERMKSVSHTCDKLLQKLTSMNLEPELSAASEPMYISLEPAPELEGDTEHKEDGEKENE
jgi:aspartokinase